MADRQNPFQPVQPTEEQARDIATLRTAFSECADELDFHAPEGRYKALARTALEEAAMWATKAITHTPPADR